MHSLGLWSGHEHPDISMQASKPHKAHVPPSPGHFHQTGGHIGAAIGIGGAHKAGVAAGGGARRAIAGKHNALVAVDGPLDAGGDGAAATVARRAREAVPALVVLLEGGACSRGRWGRVKYTYYEVP